MKNRILLALVIIVLIAESCTRTMSPYQAANSPRGRKCAIIK